MAPKFSHCLQISAHVFLTSTPKCHLLDTYTVIELKTKGIWSSPFLLRAGKEFCQEIREILSCGDVSISKGITLQRMFSIWYVIPFVPFVLVTGQYCILYDTWQSSRDDKMYKEIPYRRSVETLLISNSISFYSISSSSNVQIGIQGNKTCSWVFSDFFTIYKKIHSSFYKGCKYEN